MAAARYKMISIPEAQTTVLQHTPVLGTDTISLNAAVGRVLAETVTAKDNLPPFPASIMVSSATAARSGYCSTVVSCCSAAVAPAMIWGLAVSADHTPAMMQ